MNNFNTLYETHYNGILNFIKNKINDNVLAEDIASQVFMSVYNNLDKFDDSRGTIKSWVYKIAKNKVIDYYRANANKIAPLSIDMETDYETTLKDVIKGTSYTDDTIIGVETTERLDTFMKSVLDENEMKLMKLFCDGYRYKEICESEGIDMSVVKNILHKARLKMRNSENELKAILL